MVDVVNCACLHHLEESAHVQADLFLTMTGKGAKVINAYIANCKQVK